MLSWERCNGDWQNPLRAVKHILYFALKPMRVWVLCSCRVLELIVACSKQCGLAADIVEKRRKENILALYLEEGQRWRGRLQSAGHWIRENSRCSGLHRPHFHPPWRLFILHTSCVCMLVSLCVCVCVWRHCCHFYPVSLSHSQVRNTRTHIHTHSSR